LHRCEISEKSTFFASKQKKFRFFSLHFASKRKWRRTLFYTPAGLLHCLSGC
jgi:hypothetical protein